MPAWRSNRLSRQVGVRASMFQCLGLWDEMLLLSGSGRSLVGPLKALECWEDRKDA